MAESEARELEAMGSYPYRRLDEGDVMIVIDQGFILAPGEIVEPGDLVTVDRFNGKLRRFIAGVDENGFRVPAGSMVDASRGHLVMPYHPAPLSPLRHEKEEATPTVEMQQKSIRQRRGPTIKFTGALIAKTEFDIHGGREMRFEIWQTQGGAFIAVSATEEETRAVVVEHGDEMEMRFAVMDFFDWSDRSRSMVKDQLKWRLHRIVA
ncbi:hypothetical protein [Sphingobium sp.]|uniref:hypothetical protein n=1 Tax=Sphingobium sp. TaxID=1912891 RepID=UPI002C2A34CB|nr:hypothetical protein [Sphingobium sp.]HUD89955.1 hypothetical protein [Sphingobium sp.]